jgi:lactate dehydrogenase-like 2-hydroxyacid dehydrogenase
MFNPCMGTLREGSFKGSVFKLGHNPRGKSLGILGMGGIGRNVAAKAKGFGMKIQYFNRKELSEELSGGAKYVSFDELLATSDVLSLNLPLNVSCSIRLRGLLLMVTHKTYHFNPGIQQDEERHCRGQHCTGTSHG